MVIYIFNTCTSYTHIEWHFQMFYPACQMTGASLPDQTSMDLLPENVQVINYPRKISVKA